MEMWLKYCIVILSRKQQAELLDDQNFYLTNDNKDCVAVKGTTGLSSLWQHHLTKLPMVALETAEAIIAQYPMPRALLEVWQWHYLYSATGFDFYDHIFQAYDNNPNGHDLLANIPVRRAGGPLTSVRKIGPELSKKLHALYTKTDPDFVL